MKIQIIGCSGTGKTYLASGISEKLGIMHYDLDDIYWDNSGGDYGKKADPLVRDAKLNAMLGGDDWIIEGVYYSWLKRAFDDADVIYYLKIPRIIYCTRIFLRYLRRRLGIEKGKKGTLKSTVALIKWTDKYQKMNYPEIKEIFAKYPEKVKYIYSASAARKIIKSYGK